MGEHDRRIPPPINECAHGRFIIGSKIGSGAFGEVFRAKAATGQEVAVKLESATAKSPQLLRESGVYRRLSNDPGVPQLYWYGVEGNYNVMVIDMLGPSLENLFISCHRNFSLKTVLMLADQILTRIERMHARNYLHRDIKPENFLIGRDDKSNQVYILDFGLARKFWDTTTSEHVQPKFGKSMAGTPRYASLSTHRGIEQSRRDDMEAIGYMLIYFFRGSLPWQGIRASTKADKFKKIMERKISTSLEELCKGMPLEFVTYMRYVRDLDYEERPNYSYLRRLFRDAFVREGFLYDRAFDWCIPDDATDDNGSNEQDDPKSRNGQLKHLTAVASTTAESPSRIQHGHRDNRMLDHISQE